MKKILRALFVLSKWYALLNTFCLAYIGIAEWIFYARSHYGEKKMTDLMHDLIYIATDEWKWFLKK